MGRIKEGSHYDMTPFWVTVCYHLVKEFTRLNILNELKWYYWAKTEISLKCKKGNSQNLIREFPWLEWSVIY